MKNYKPEFYNIPPDLVNQIQKKLQDLEGYLVTPLIVNPDDLSVMFGIIDNNELKYKITISLKD